MRSVRFGNLIICKHVFDNWSKRYPYHGDFDFENREQRIVVARQIRTMLDDCIQVPKHDGQVIFVHLEENAAYPAEIGSTLTKIVTSYPAGQSLVNKARSLRGYAKMSNSEGQCREQSRKIGDSVYVQESKVEKEAEHSNFDDKLSKVLDKAKDQS